MRSSSQLQSASSFLLRRTKGAEVEEEDFHHHHLPHHHHRRRIIVSAAVVRVGFTIIVVVATCLNKMVKGKGQHIARENGNIAKNLLAQGGLNRQWQPQWSLGASRNESIVETDPSYHEAVSDPLRRGTFSQRLHRRQSRHHSRSTFLQRLHRRL